MFFHDDEAVIVYTVWNTVLIGGQFAFNDPGPIIDVAVLSYGLFPDHLRLRIGGNPSGRV